LVILLRLSERSMRILLDLAIDKGRLHVGKVLQEGNEGIV
jgi:hypothetical protein